VLVATRSDRLVRRRRHARRGRLRHPLRDEHGEQGQERPDDAGRLSISLIE
jgi:hypothetical protein